MNKYLILLTLLIVSGCCSDRFHISTDDPRRSIALTAGTIIDWRGIPESKKTEDMLLWESLVLTADPNAGPDKTQKQILKYDGQFLCTDYLKEMAVETTSEDLRKNLLDYIWDFFTGKKK
jgi:hypothetical protein